MLYTFAEYDTALESIESSAMRFNDGQLPTPLSIESGKTRERISGAYAAGLAGLVLSDIDTFGHDAYRKPLDFTISGVPDDGVHDVKLFVFVDEHRSVWSRCYFVEKLLNFDLVDEAEHMFCSWVCDVVIPRCIGLLAFHSKYDGRGHLLETVYGTSAKNFVAEYEEE